MRVGIGGARHAGLVSRCTGAVKNELPSRSPLLASLCSLCCSALTTMTELMPPKVERREVDTSQHSKVQSNLTPDFLHEIMDAAINENFYLANRESFN